MQGLDNIQCIRAKLKPSPKELIKEPLMREARTRYVLPNGQGYRIKMHIDDDGWQGSFQRGECNLLQFILWYKVIDCGNTPVASGSAWQVYKRIICPSL